MSQQVEMNFGGMKPSVMNYGRTAYMEQSVNIKSTENGCVPCVSPAVAGYFGTNVVAAAHKTDSTENIICFNHGSSRLYVAAQSGETVCELTNLAGVSVSSISVTGNIITVHTSEGRKYIWYDPNNNTYVWLGKFPDIDASFGLTLEPAAESGEYKVSDMYCEGVAKSPNSPRSSAYYVRIATIDDIDLHYGTTPESDRCTVKDIGGVDYCAIRVNINHKFKKRTRYRLHLITNVAGKGQNVYAYGNCPENGDFQVSDKNMSGKTALISMTTTDNSGNYMIIYTYVDLDSLTLAFLAGPTGSSVCDDYEFNGSIEIDEWQEPGIMINDDVGYSININSANYNKLMLLMSELVKNAENRGHFVHPFLARYAVRLYDGEYAYVSEPALIKPNVGYAPIITYSTLGETFKAAANAFEGELAIRARSVIPKDWLPIIRSIDVYASPPIVPYMAGEFDSHNTRFVFKKYFSLVGYGVWKPWRAGAQPVGESELQQVDYTGTDRNGGYVAILNPLPDEEIASKISNTSSYYLVGSINADRLGVGLTPVDIGSGNISSLIGGRILKEGDTSGYYDFACGKTTVINNRVHLFGCKGVLPDPFSPSYFGVYLNDRSTYVIDSYVYISHVDGVVIKHSKADGCFSGTYYSYPHRSAYKAVFYLSDKSGKMHKRATIPLKPHPFLMSSFWCAKSLAHSLPWVEYSGEITEESCEEVYIDLPSDVFISLRLNPFCMPIANTESFMNERVLAVNSTTTLYSEGQYSKFPAVIHTDTHDYLMSVGDDGVYSSRQTLSYQTHCANSLPISTPIGVCSVTDNGVEVLVKANVRSNLTNGLICHDKPDVEIGKLSELLSINGINIMHGDRTWHQLIMSANMSSEYVTGTISLSWPWCESIIVYNPETQNWHMENVGIGKMLDGLTPDKFIDNHGFMRIVRGDGDVYPHQYMITRPITMQMPDTLKTVRSVIIRGSFQTGHVQSVLYGSRNLSDWHLVNSSKTHIIKGKSGTPYKYFRLALLLSLTKGESITGASFEVEAKYTNKLR